MNWFENRSRQSHICGHAEVFTGPVYVVRDNIDTDQIIPAQYQSRADDSRRIREAGQLCDVGAAELTLSGALREGRAARQRVPIVVGGRTLAVQLA
jgi:hypothetical protein